MDIFSRAEITRKMKRLKAGEAAQDNEGQGKGQTTTNKQVR